MQNFTCGLLTSCEKKTDKSVSLDYLKEEFLQACFDCNGQGYEKISSNYLTMKSLNHAALIGEDREGEPQAKCVLTPHRMVFGEIP